MGHKYPIRGGKMKSKSRGNGQGCAVKVKANCWKAIATIGYVDGKAIRRTKSGFLTKAEALAYIPTLKQKKSETRAKMTFKDAFDEMLKARNCGKSTINCYKSGIRLFEEYFSYKLDELDVDELQECLDETDLGIKTRQNARTALGLVYKWAIPRGLVPDAINKASFLSVGEGEAPKKRAFTADELRKIEAAVGVVPYADYVFCHCFLGFRPSALLNLKCSDYNLRERAFIGGIKTEAGIGRTVTVSPVIGKIINHLILNAHGGYVFGRNGEKMSPRFYRHQFYEVLAAVGIQALGDHTLTPHSCRHTFATLMKRIEAPEKDKLELIGHTSGEMLRYYQDVNFEDLRRITDRLEIG